MLVLHPKYSKEASGKNIVILPQIEFELILEELEVLEDIKLYDEDKKDNEVEGMALKNYIESRNAL